MSRRKKNTMDDIFDDNDGNLSYHELESNLNYIGQEKAARKLLLDEKLAPVEKIALMTTKEVCEEIVKHFHVVACMSERAILVKKSDMPIFKNLVKYLDR